MHVVTKRVKDLTPTEYRKCLALNMQGRGQMQGELVYSRKTTYASRKDDKALMIFDGDRLVAWCLLFNKGTAYFYTRKTERRKGYGKRLMQEVKQIKAKPYVVPWDTTSGKFFRNYVSEVNMPVAAKYYINA